MMKTNMSNPIKMAFCAKEQKELEHELTVEGAMNDITLTCSSCGGFIKVPAGTKKEDLNTFLAEHEVANTRDLSLQVAIMTEDEKQAALEELI